MDSKTTQDDLCYRTSRWQKLLYGLEREAQPGLEKMEEKGAERAPRFADFQRELFSRFYNPRTKKLDEPTEGAEWAEKLHGLAEEVAEFKVLQERTKGDEMWSGMATATVNKSVVAKMAKQESNQDLDQMQKRVEALKDMAQQGVNVGKRLKKAEKQLERAKEQAEALKQGLDPAQLRNAIRVACEKAQDEISEAESMISAFSYGDQAGAPMSKENLQEKRELAKRIGSNPKLKAIAKMAGRLRVVAAEKQRSKTNYARDEVTSVEQGADVERLLPNEWALLASDDADLEAIGLARIVERKCMQYKLAGREKEGRGPVVLAVDESGSMTGDPEVWSKAVSMALLDVCQRQKRSWHYIHFDSRVSRVDTVKAGAVDTAALMECMNHFTGGGTSFEAPLRKAVELIEADGGFKKADILLVTDGYCQTSDEFNKWFADKVDELDVTVFTVLVNGIDAGDAVAQWSDHIFTLDEIVGDGAEFEQQMFSI